MSTEKAGERPIRATGPRPGAEDLRTAYLGLLKLCLCDLAGDGTDSVHRTFGADRLLYRRELPDDEIGYRLSGRDWPLRGLTMVGLQRLDDLQRCVESVVADDVAGDLIEVGTWRGGASILMRATLDALGGDERTVWLADSFEGFPAPDHEAFPEDSEADDLSTNAFLAAPLECVQASFQRFGLERGVRFVPGFFNETMPGLSGGRWSVVRLDGDTYESTWLALESLYPGLSAGGYLIVDDYGFVAECRRAVDEFRAANGIEEPIEEVDWTCVRWRRTSEPTATRARAFRGQSLEEQTPDRSVPVVAGRIPTLEELELRQELSGLRQRVQEAEVELERLRRSNEG